MYEGLTPYSWLSRVQSRVSLSIKARYLMVGLLFSLGTPPSPPWELLLFRASAIISCLHLAAQLLELKKLENFAEKIHLLILTFMAA